MVDIRKGGTLETLVNRPVVDCLHHIYADQLPSREQFNLSLSVWIIEGKQVLSRYI